MNLPSVMLWWQMSAYFSQETYISIDESCFEEVDGLTPMNMHQHIFNKLLHEARYVLINLIYMCYMYWFPINCIYLLQAN